MRYEMLNCRLILFNLMILFENLYFRLLGIVWIWIYWVIIIVSLRKVIKVIRVLKSDVCGLNEVVLLMFGKKG